MSDLPRFFFSNEMIQKKHTELKDNLEKKMKQQNKNLKGLRARNLIRLMIWQKNKWNYRNLMDSTKLMRLLRKEK